MYTLTQLRPQFPWPRPEDGRLLWRTTPTAGGPAPGGSSLKPKWKPSKWLSWLSLVSRYWCILVIFRLSFFLCLTPFLVPCYYIQAKLCLIAISPPLLSFAEAKTIKITFVIVSGKWRKLALVWPTWSISSFVEAHLDGRYSPSCWDGGEGIRPNNGGSVY